MTPEQKIDFAILKIKSALYRGLPMNQHLLDAQEALETVLRDIAILRASVAIARAEIVDVAKRVAG